MAQASHRMTVAASPERFMRVLVDFAAYPSFLPWVQAVEVLRHEQGPGAEAWEVRFEVLLVRPLRYTLRLERSGTRLQWSLVEGMLHAIEGAWELSEVDGGTQAEYRLELQVGSYVPASILDSLRQRDLPQLMERFQRRAAELA